VRFHPEWPAHRLQLIGQPFREADLLATAHAYEHAHNWSTKFPAL